ncbi:hypothetical protein [Winogradskya humida]|uniref:Uncharacterized protein n=1 Tax=Winogradskya humida TaxID=113566 RepID=A0ABQ3ZYB5_9ACTN|nr:hypothetical protein [Actinoplanes humidus]GIE23578.1 hypothetical protein Ahu01nite_066800 [Actinoplanes humidus]
MSATARISGVLAGLLLLAAFLAVGIASGSSNSHRAVTHYQAGLIWDTTPTVPADGAAA